MPAHDRDACLFTVTTERFVPGTLVMLHSFLEHHPRFGGDVVIVHDGLPEALRRALAGSFGRVRFEPVSGELQARLERLAALPVFRNRLPNFYFLEAFRLGGYRKMLYFDSDLLFRAPWPAGDGAPSHRASESIRFRGRSGRKLLPLKASARLTVDLGCSMGTHRIHMVATVAGTGGIPIIPISHTPQERGHGQ